MTTFPRTAWWKRHYTEAEFRALVADRDCWPAVQEQVGYSLHAMRYWKRKFGILHSQIKRQEIIDLWENTTMPQSEIARQVGHGSGTVRQVLREAGFITGLPAWLRTLSPEELAEFKAQVLDSDNWDDLQAKLGCHRRTLSRWRAKWLKEAEDEGSDLD